ncbi:unnamed protein product [Amoebophrya sp. A120]|nr:unnamed protein product [Amoebophrya sp. A120]|eukprot:GSA120T00014416001.1
MWKMNLLYNKSPRIFVAGVVLLFLHTAALLQHHSHSVKIFADGALLRPRGTSAPPPARSGVLPPLLVAPLDGGRRRSSRSAGPTTRYSRIEKDHVEISAKKNVADSKDLPRLQFFSMGGENVVNAVPFWKWQNWTVEELYTHVEREIKQEDNGRRRELPCRKVDLVPQVLHLGGEIHLITEPLDRRSVGSENRGERRLSTVLQVDELVLKKDNSVSVVAGEASASRTSATQREGADHVDAAFKSDVMFQVLFHAAGRKKSFPNKSRLREAIALWREDEDFEANGAAREWIVNEFGPVAEWNLCDVKNLSNLFNPALVGTGFHSSFQITDWYTRGVKNMHALFSGWTEFDQDIRRWDVRDVTNMSFVFSGAANFNQNLGSWDVSAVTLMRNMFEGARRFNQDLSGWDVSGVKDFCSMFYKAVAFNQPLDSWGSKLDKMPQSVNMQYMLAEATAFNQSLKSFEPRMLRDLNQVAHMLLRADSFRYGVLDNLSLQHLDTLGPILLL